MGSLSKSFLQQKQSLPLEAKIVYCLRRAEEFIQWCEENDKEPVVSFSGGKDSAVLAHILRSRWSWLKLVFVNTRLEFPEIIQFVKKQTNVDIVTPKKTFKEIVEQYGFPAVSKKVSRAIEDLQLPGREKVKNLRLTGMTSDGRSAPSFKLAQKWRYLVNGPRLSDKCCNYMKKEPINRYDKENNAAHFVGTMASDSQDREKAYLKNGCNSFNGKEVKSTPMSIFTEQDVLHYVRENRLEICSVYGEIVETEKGLKCSGYDRTGCFKCAFGACAEQEKTGTNRFIRLYDTHPKLWEVLMREHQHVFDYIGLPTKPGQEWRGWKPFDKEEEMCFL